jgi:endogenous inhibitor of DNA gyrase (YacG/DUF329 family)
LDIPGVTACGSLREPCAACGQARVVHRRDRDGQPWCAQRNIKAAIALLDWLTARDLTLDDARQGDLDAWLAEAQATHRTDAQCRRRQPQGLAAARSITSRNTEPGMTTTAARLHRDAAVVDVAVHLVPFRRLPPRTYSRYALRIAVISRVALQGVRVGQAA